MYCFWHSGFTKEQNFKKYLNSVQFSSVAQLCLTLCNPMNCSMPGLPVHHQLMPNRGGEGGSSDRFLLLGL